MKNKKQAAPKRDERIKKQQAYTRLDAPKPSMNKESADDVRIEQKAFDKARREEAKRAKKEAAIEAHPLHFHPLRFILNLLIFIICTVALTALTILLLLSGRDLTIFTHTITLPTLSLTMQFYIGVIIMVLFPIWMAEFQLAFRRIFRIGRYERIRKAIEKKQNKLNNKSSKKAA